jgi:phosphatidyl-N-methylethanolamine N-methyltransferase
MSFWLLLVAALVLGVERACYVWIARAPGSFRRWCARPGVARLGEPVEVVRALFVAFKLLQGAVFLGWCLAFADGWPVPASGAVLALGGVLIAVGQILSTLVFYRLGRVGIFFGDRLGYDVPWCRAFPFSLLAHPQYVGALMTIWGFFLIIRFPHDDWILLPALETAYYVLGACLEADDVEEPPDRSPSPVRHRSRSIS